MKQKKFIEPDEAIFRDREKEAKFWEENFRETWKRGKPIKVKFALSKKSVSSATNVPLDAKLFAAVKVRAKEKGVPPVELIQMWILEKLGGKRVLTGI